MSCLLYVKGLPSLCFELFQTGVQLEIKRGSRAKRSLTPSKVIQILLEIPIEALMGEWIIHKSAAQKDD